ncbi:uncharacterized protein LOC107293755 [Protobothrops mucrosquamatus]|uniref:uncharacterized protein LOC107293755 n=1 Tax=Protobothrops mucrosquamatus TaxID=103944 RepID=UPI000775ACCB|nr:uncharacterized protein LOC107293755 [Protobothrops mucrosquamatus]
MEWNLRSSKKKVCTPVNDSSCFPISVDFSTLSRGRLQVYCKELGLRATGKNVELVERLEEYHKKSSLKIACNKEETNKPEEKSDSLESLTKTDFTDMTKNIETDTSEEKTDMIRGWCVVHGVQYFPESSWVPLLLHRGLVCVQDGENMVPFHLSPSNIPVPEGLLDNYVCVDCVLRNQEKPEKDSICQQIQEKSDTAYTFQTALKKRKTTSSSFLATDGAKEKRRTIEIRKLYQPQEDQAYAQRVDGLLSKMAKGELGMDRALRPLQPLVVHSPTPYEKISPSALHGMDYLDLQIQKN